MSATENTLLIIKPNFISNTNEILQLLLENGFRITHRKQICLTPEQAAEFYKEIEKTDARFAIKVMALSKGPSEAVILNKSNAVKDLLTLIEISNYFFNLESEDRIHASISNENASNEIKYIFPNVMVQLSRRLNFVSYCGRNNLTGLLADGIFSAYQSKAEDLRGFLSNWFVDGSKLY
ncbi:nucleoside diphosphate kinase isoform X2 [Episyrphus balteatus]|uniref:nucleoside diphosphate kinase isoform X2 n=1 Tax=Episyrphus balteatus TaxID=286459 RepID=UPI002484E4F8|nr:nucleoside diphosphate kinase isoform X2 [Episyrphus balteatus]